MKYVKNLRKTIEQFFPEFRDNPTKLEIYIREGGVKIAYGNLAFAHKYLITVHFNQINCPVEKAIIPLLYFMYVYYPDLVMQSDGTNDFLQYDAKILDTDEYNLTIGVQISENVAVNTDGTYEIKTNTPPPDDSFADVIARLKDLIPAPNDIPDY